MVLFEVLGAALMAIAAITAGGIRRVPEGHVAVYYRGGALLKHTDEPGFRFAFPLITTCEYVQTTVQTDNVLHIPCGTAGGTVIEFERIEVVNQLAREFVYATVKNYTVNYDKTWIYDKIHHEINQICSRSTLEEMYITKFDSLDETLRDALQRDIDIYSPGIRIIAIRVTKPKIPTAIRQNYEAIEAERTKLKVAEETQRVVEQTAVTDKRKAIIEAEKKAAVEAVQREQLLRQKENDQAIANIQNEMHAAKARADADAEYYRATKEAEANKLLHTPERIQLETVRAISNNTKIYFGEKIPQMLGGTMAGLGVSVP